MTKLFVSLLSTIVFVCFVLPVPAQVRPRRVGNSQSQTSTAPSDPVPTAPTRPPLLGGANRPAGQQQSTTKTPEQSGPEEVDAGDVIKVDTTLVTIPVSVLDRDGRYVPNLNKNDFRIWEDGVEQDVAFFASVEKPFSVFLVLDTSPSTKFRLEDIQDAAITFVNQLRSDDKVMVVSFNNDIKILSELTTDRVKLQRAIMRAHTDNGTRLYDAMDMLMNQYMNRVQGRKAIVLFTDGVDTTSHRASYNSTLRLAEESDAPFYSVDYDTSGMRGVFGQGMPGGRGTIFGIPVPMPGIPGSTTAGNPGDYRRAINYLHALSDTTGGRFYSGDAMFGIGQAFAWIAEELGRQYSLGYYPKVVGKAGQRRAIKVRVNEPDVVVKARDSYVYSNKTAQATPPDKQPYFSDNRK